MPEILRWPDEFADSTPAVDFDASFIALLEEVRAFGANVFADHNWSLFEFRRDDRSIHFVRRGRSRRIDGVNRMNRETYWEVRPEQNGVAHRLSVLFGIREFACIVVCGVPHIRLIATRWLDGMPLADVASGVTFWDRLDPSVPLEVAK